MDFINAIILLSNFVLVPSITYGSQLALGAIGVTLIYGVLRFANFAYGDLMAFGTMCVILFTWLFKSWGINLGILPTALLALPFGIILTIGVSLFFDIRRFSFRVSVLFNLTVYWKEFLIFHCCVLLHFCIVLVLIVNSIFLYFLGLLEYPETHLLILNQKRI